MSTRKMFFLSHLRFLIPVPVHTAFAHFSLSVPGTSKYIENNKVLGSKETSNIEIHKCVVL